MILCRCVMLRTWQRETRENKERIFFSPTKNNDDRRDDLLAHRRDQNISDSQSQQDGISFHFDGDDHWPLC